MKVLWYTSSLLFFNIKRHTILLENQFLSEPTKILNIYRFSFSKTPTCLSPAMVLSVQTSSRYLFLVPQTFIPMLGQPLNTNCASKQTGIPGGKVTLQCSHSVMSNSLYTMDCSTPGFPVHHQLLEFTQTHVHWVGDAIQSSHPLSSPSPPTFNLSQHQGLFQGISSSHQVAKGLEFQLQHQSFQWVFRTDFL